MVISTAIDTNLSSKLQFTSYCPKVTRLNFQSQDTPSNPHNNYMSYPYQSSSILLFDVMLLVKGDVGYSCLMVEVWPPSRMKVYYYRCSLRVLLCTGIKFATLILRLFADLGHTMVATPICSRWYCTNQ